MKRTSTPDLRAEGEALGPWHLNVRITDELSTADLHEAEPTEDRLATFYDPTVGFTQLLDRMWPAGLEGRTVLDCACNCGAYLFLCHDRGAGKCYGFDAREHWIRQAEWLRRNRDGDHSDMQFEARDLYEIPSLDLGQFDIVLFRGIFYHLPDPIEGLRIVADATGEAMLLATATKGGWPDGALVAGDESKSMLLSGIHGPQWYPTGPRVMAQMFNWFGLPHVRCYLWWRPEQNAPGLEAVDMVAVRSESSLAAYDGDTTKVASMIRDTATFYVPPHSSIAVLAEVVPPLHQRSVSAFIAGEDPVAALHETNADYLLTAGQGLHEANESGLMAYLTDNVPTVGYRPRQTIVHDLRGLKRNV
jgi:SAM-dependent methyltransferase